MADIIQDIQVILKDFFSEQRNVQLVLAGLVVCLAYLWNRKTYSYWSNRNVKHPPVIPFFGNSLKYFTKPRRDLEVELSRQYGGVYGYYSGSKPILVCADANVIKQICVSSFSNFKNHFKLGGLPTSFQRNFLILQKGDKWKRMRSAMSTTFTSSKMKKMYTIIDKCADELVNSVDEQLTLSNLRKENKDKQQVPRFEFNIAPVVRLYALDVISSCGYGFSMRREIPSINSNSKELLEKYHENNVETNKAESKEKRDKKNIAAFLAAAADNDKNKLKSDSRDTMSELIRNIFLISKLRFYANYILPHEILNWFGLSLLREDGMAMLASKLKMLMESRRKNNKKHNDYLQLLMEAHVDDEFDFVETDVHENHHLSATNESLHQEHEQLLKELKASQVSKPGANSTGPKESLKGQLTDHEILCNAVMLLMVGTETSQAAMSECIYMLADNPHVQDKLANELIKLGTKSADEMSYSFNYEDLAAHKYLDAVLSEALRMQPPVIYMDRMTDEDFYIPEYDIRLEKGTPVNLSFFAVHYNPEYWLEPEKFDPDRFMPENRHKIVPGSYCPFGLGPRACIGMRFALAETKCGLAKLVTQFKFSRAPNTVYPSKGNLFTFFQNQSLDLRVVATRR